MWQRPVIMKAEAEFVFLRRIGRYTEVIPEVVRQQTHKATHIKIYFLISMRCRDTGGIFNKFIVTNGMKAWRYAIEACVGDQGCKLILDLEGLDHVDEFGWATKAIDELILFSNRSGGDDII